MTSFTRSEVRFLVQCCRAYAQDGYRLPKGAVPIHRKLQETLIADAIDKLTNVLQPEALTKQEASMLIVSILHVSAEYEIVEKDFSLSEVCAKLSALAEPDPQHQ